MKMQMTISAAIIINPKDKKILIIERKKPEGRLCWQFPAGKIEFNESSRHAAKRETLEETNVICRIDKLIGSQVHPDTKVKIDYWLGHFVRGELRESKREVRRIKWATLEQMRQLITTDIYKPIYDVLLKESIPTTKKSNLDELQVK